VRRAVVAANDGALAVVVHDEHATRLALGEKVDLEREYETTQTDWMNRRRRAALRNSDVVIW
jgi:hypothetical protein